MRLTSKGQVTIPQAIREKLGLLPHVEVEFDIVAGGVRIRPRRAKKTRGQMMLEAMRKAPKPLMTTDEIMALTRGE